MPTNISQPQKGIRVSKAQICAIRSIYVPINIKKSLTNNRKFGKLRNNHYLCPSISGNRNKPLNNS
jgi:hypothetical protein